MGNGKSTTGNMLISEIMKIQKEKPKKDQAFEAKKSTKAVTTKVDIKFFKEINLFDSPGLNDPNKLRSDNETFKNICDVILETAFKKDREGNQHGLSACL